MLGGGGVLLTLGDVMTTQRYLNGEQQAAGGGLPGVICAVCADISKKALSSCVHSRVHVLSRATHYYVNQSADWVV